MSNSSVLPSLYLVKAYREGDSFLCIAVFIILLVSYYNDEKMPSKIFSWITSGLASSEFILMQEFKLINKCSVRHKETIMI